MIFDKIFPNWPKAIRNAVAVGLIAAASNFSNAYPPSAQTIYTFITAFIIAFCIEFGNTYRQANINATKKKDIKTFFLP